MALDLAQEAKKQSPDDSYYVSDTLGWIYSQKGVYQMALEELRPAARSLENDAVIHYHLGMTYYRMGQRLQARRALERALKLGLAPASLAGTAERILRDLASSQGKSKTLQKRRKRLEGAFFGQGTRLGGGAI